MKNMKKRGMSIVLGWVTMMAAVIFQAVPTQAEDSKVTIHLKSGFTEQNQESVAVNFNKAVADAREHFPGYHIEYESMDLETYKTRIKDLAAADKTPDIFMSWGAGFIRPFVEEGKAAALDDYISNESMHEMSSDNADMFTFDGKMYGLTSQMWVGTLYCNQEMFDECNLEIPETFSELIGVCATFREKGIQPIALGEKDLWPGQQYVNEFIIQLAGADRANAMAAKEEQVDNDAVIQAADYVIEMVHAGAFSDGAVDMSNDEAYTSFCRGEVPMIFTNSGFTGEAIADSSSVRQVTAVRFPLVTGGDPTQFFGGAIDGLCMSSDCAFPEQTYQVLEYLSRQWAENDGGMTTWKVSDEAQMNRDNVTKQIISFSSHAEGYSLAWDTLLEGEDAQAWLQDCAMLYSGEISSGKEFAEKLAQDLGER